MTHVILTVIAFGLVAVLLAIVASKNNVVKNGIQRLESAAVSESKVIESHNAGVAARFKGLLSHVKNWNEFYVWVPVGILGVIGLAMLVQYLSGRASHEDADTLVGMAFRFVAVVFSIIGTSVFFNQVTGWYDKELEKLEGWAHVTARSVEIVACIVVFFGILFLAFH